MDMRAGQHDLCACDRVWLVVLSSAPLALVSCSVVSNEAADLLPVGRISQSVLSTDWHCHFPPYKPASASAETDRWRVGHSRPTECPCDAPEPPPLYTCGIGLCYRIGEVGRTLVVSERKFPTSTIHSFISANHRVQAAGSLNGIVHKSSMNFRLSVWNVVWNRR